jgi:hypothetical protein
LGGVAQHSGIGVHEGDQVEEGVMMRYTSIVYINRKSINSAENVSQVLQTQLLILLLVQLLLHSFANQVKVPISVETAALRIEKSHKVLY